MPIAESEYVSPIWRDGIFDGKVVFVTGGAGDICGAQTRALVRLGADACIVGRSIERAEAAAREIASVRDGAKVLGIGGCDVRDFVSLENAVNRCVRELGGIDFVVAGAAGNFVAPLSSMTPNAFKTIMDIDLLGSFNTVKATMPHLVRARPFAKSILPPVGPSPAGRIIFVSATFHYTGMPLQAHMSAAKAGVDSLMASVALEYGPVGVTSNVIAPGPIESTEGMARLSGSSAKDPQNTEAEPGPDAVGATTSAGAAGDAMSAASAAAARRMIPVGRWGVVRDIADATVFLFSEAGSHINGHALAVDGGAWRRQGGAMTVGLDEDMKYPDFLVEGKISKFLKDGRGSKARL